MTAVYGNDYELHCGDCVGIMPTIASNSIDLTVTSPPYDNLRSYGEEFDPASFDWHSIIRELWRVTAVGGVVVWVVDDATINGSETGTSFRQALFAMECGFNLHDTMFYSTNKPPLQHNRYEKCIEYMFVFSKGRPKTTNLIREKSIYHGIDKRKTSRHTHNGTYIEDKSIRTGGIRKAPQPTKIKTHLWHYKTGFGHSGDQFAFQHPASFPEQLAHDHIISWSNEGDLVFDPMMGSGTVGKMALQNGRRFLGIELDAGYFENAKIRIQNAVNEFVMTEQEIKSGQQSMFEAFAQVAQ